MRKYIKCILLFGAKTIHKLPLVGANIVINNNRGCYSPLLLNILTTVTDNIMH